MSIAANSQRQSGSSDFLAAGGEMGARIRAFNWAEHPLGPIEGWPQSLKIVLRILLTSRYAMWLGWGPDFTFFCNDAYLPTVGVKRDWVLGAPARKVWAEIWKDIGPRAESVVRTQLATWDTDLLLFLERSGFPEETYHTFSYSPAPDDHGGVGGMLCVVTEETERVISERRLAMIGELGAALTGVNKEADVFAAVQRMLTTHPRDIPFGLVYLFDPPAEGTANITRARLACLHGVQPDPSIAPEIIDLGMSNAWPLEKVLADADRLSVENISERWPNLPTGPWDKPPRYAALVPISQPGQDRPAGCLVAGINPYRSLDEKYEGFLRLMTGQIASGIANARAYAAEHKRAESLAELDRAKTAFFSNVSHEFRTPLTLMLGPLEDLMSNESRGLTEKGREEIEVAHRNSLRLLKLVNTLLDFSRVEAGRAQSHFEPVDIAALTADLASTFRSTVERAGMRLVVDCQSVSQHVYVDRDMWEKIVLNLISNAFKHTFEGEIAVSVKQRGGTVDMEVRDTGIGIPSDAIPRLFERFFRVAGAASRTYEGSGIGLSLVHELVRQHDGEIRVESEVGKGSRFIVSIPAGPRTVTETNGRNETVATKTGNAAAFIAEAGRWIGAESTPAAVPKASSDRPHASSASNETRKKPRIVLADDNADMRLYITRLLEPEYRVEALEDGAAALAAIQRERPDLVLTDVMMPKLDGFALIRELRADASTRDIPVVMLSARAGEESKIEGLDAGASDYLIKPFSASEVLARVRAHISMSELRRGMLERETRLRAEAEHLNTVAMVLTAELDLRSLVRKMTDAGVSLTGAELGAFISASAAARDNPDDLEVVIGSTGPGIGAPSVGEKDRLRILVEDAMRRGRPLCVDEPPGMIAGAWGAIRSWLVVPVMPKSGRGLGALVFGHRDADVFAERSVRLAEGVAAQAAVAIDNASLFHEATRAQHALHESEKRFSAFMEHLPGAAWIKDAEGNYLYTNPECKRLFTLAVDARNHDFESPFQTDDSKELERMDARVVKTGLATSSVERVQQRDGLIRHSIVSRFPMPGPDGNRRLLGGIGIDITDRVIAEYERRDAAALLEGTIDALTSHIAILDASGVIIKVNEAWRRFARANGYETSSFGIGMNYLDACEPHELGSSECTVASASAAAGLRDVIAEKRDRFVLEYPCHSPTKERWFMMRVTRFGHGGERRIVVSHEDITERHEAEDAIREGSNRLRLATDAINPGTWDMNIDAGRLDLDARGRELLGIGADAAVSYEALLGALHADDRERVKAEAIKVLTTPGTERFDVECRINGADDLHERWIRATGRTFNEDGGPRRFVGIMQDVTARKHAEDALRQSEEMLRLATDAADVGTWVRDLRSDKVAWSPKLEEIFGMDVGGFGGRHGDFRDIVHPEDRDKVASAVEGAIQQRQEYEVEFRYLHASGEHRWMVGRGRAWYDAAGRPVMLAGTGEDITARRRVHEALRESEERFRQMADFAPVMVWVTEPDGTCTFLSKSWYEFTGQTPETGLGFGWTDAVHEEDRERSREIFLHALREQAPFRIEYRLRRADGVYRWAIDAATPRFSESGDYLGYIGSVIDITDRKEAEAALRTSEEQFRMLADSIPQLAWIARPDGRSVWYNKRWYEYTGTTLEEMEGWGWQSVLDPDDVGRIIERFKAAIAEGKTWEDTFAIRQRDGEMRWHLSRALPMRDDSGRIVRWFGTNTDVTEQREAADALRVSEERFRLMADSAPTLIWLAGTNKLRSWFNKPWLDFTGRSMEDELGAGWMTGVHPEDMEHCLTVYTDAFEQRREFRLEYRLRRFDGEYRWMLAHGVPMFSAAKRFTGFIGSCIDITDQVHARQTLERQRVLLEEAVRARTEELQTSNERLRLAERMASLGTLSAGLGHDMGNLLVPLRVRLESLARAGLAPELLEDVEAIRSSADYLHRLASGLRMLAIDPRRVAKSEYLELQTWWSEAGPLLKNALPRGIELTTQFPAEPCRVAVSRAALTQAVFNLVQNAGDAMRSRGTGKVSVWAETDGEVVRIGVTDNGPGMTQEVLTRCMEPFFTTKTRGISTGLGLALVYGLVAEAGGSTDVQSSLGVGTTFVMKLKAYTQVEKTAAGKRAAVTLRDPRLRALVTAELRALEFSVGTGETDITTADVVFAEDASTIQARAAGSAVVILSDDAAGIPDALVLGTRPKLQAIREVLRRVVNGDR